MPLKQTQSLPIDIPPVYSQKKLTSNSPKIMKRKRRTSTSPRNSESNPPYSRLFVICDKEASEKDIMNYFSKFGPVQYCKLIKDKTTNQSKGVCYVKFEKTSSAAKALESKEEYMENYKFPIRIELAESKGKKKSIQFSSEPEDTPARSRLFVVCPKELLEKSIDKKFSEFPDYEYSKVIVDKITGISKGFAFIKFSKASSAAEALEIVNSIGQIDNNPVKVLIADPKAKEKIQENPPVMNYHHDPYYPGWVYPQHQHQHQHHHQQSLQIPINVECDINISRKELSEIFGKYDGFEYCDFTILSQTKTTAIYHVYFSNINAAILAINSINGIEYPEGCPIICSLDHEYYQVNSPPAGVPLPYMMPPPMMYCSPSPMYMPPPPMYNQPQTWIKFTSTNSMFPDLIGIIFSQYGMIEYLHMFTEYTGIIKYFDSFSAISCTRSLDGMNVYGTTLHITPYSQEINEY